MRLGLHDVYLLSPELALVGLAVLLVLLDLVVKRKGVLLTVGAVALALPVALSVVLWNDVHGLPEGADTGFFGTLVVDKFALFFKFLILGVLALILLASNEYVNRFRQHQGEFLGLMMLSATGLMLLAAAADLITLYISLELASLPVVALAAFLRTDIRSTEAGIKFLLLSGISSALLLYGFVFIYGATGTVQVFTLDPAVPTVAQMITQPEPGLPFGSFLLLTGIVLAVAGFGFKLSIVPFHMWTPDVYEGAPTPIAAFLSVASKAAAFAVVLRLFYTAFGSVSTDWALLIAGLSVASMTVGNLVAMAQSNMKRLLGYSAIAHAGYMMIGLAAIAARSSEAESAGLGPSGLLFYLAAYAATNLAAFFAVIAIANKTDSEEIDDFAGMSQRAPWLAGILAFALVSLTGIPPTAGFIGKLFLFNAAINADLVWLAVVGVINSVLSAYYYFRIIRVMYLRPAVSQERVPSDAPMRVALLITGAAVLVLGVVPGELQELASSAASVLVP